MPKHGTSDEVHLSGLAPGYHSSEETSQRWRFFGDTVSNLTGSEIEPQIFRADSDVFNHHTDRPVNPL